MKRVPWMFRALVLASVIGCADNSDLDEQSANATGLPGATTGGGMSPTGTNGSPPATNWKTGDSVDVDGDGVMDGIAVDDNSDGVPDGVDTNADGKSDKPLPPFGMPVNGGGNLPMPKADDPCGTDVAFNGGAVRPSLGKVQALPNAATDPAMPGQYKVAEIGIKVPIEAGMLSAAGYDISVENGELSGTLYAPSKDGTTIATDAKFPLLVGGAGFQATYADYKGYWKQFASHGIAVIGVTTRGSNVDVLHDKEAFETSQTISWALTESDFKAQLDPDKIATTGHSKGGKVAFFTAAIDPRVDIVFGWDPSNAGGPPCGVASIIGAACHKEPVAPNCGAVKAMIEQPEGVLQYMHAETFVFGVPPDGTLNPEESHNSINFYRGAPSAASLVYFKGGHAAWVESGVAGTLFGDDDVVRITKMVQTAKLLKFFFGMNGMDDYLPPSGAKLMSEGKVTMLKTK